MFALKSPPELERAGLRLGRVHRSKEKFRVLVPSNDVSSEKSSPLTEILEETEMSEEKYAKQRQELLAYLEKKGEILEPEHMFAELVLKIAEKLGFPQQTEVVVIDTEEVDAFFHPLSRMIVLTRGFGRYFLQEGLPLAEDHLAAVLSHELEHAQVIGDEYVNRVQSSYLERIKSMQSHAEEYRADSEALRRLSKAGYNPQALLQLLRTSPLTHSRNDLGHPEQIERIRKLEERFADDEHPLSNTSKELTPLNEELLVWIASDSDIYNPTEQLIRSPVSELDQKLEAAKTQQQFWEVQRYKKNVDKIAVAKGLASEENQWLERLAMKLMVYEAFCGKQAFVEGQPVAIDSDINNGLVNGKWNASKEVAGKIFYATRTFATGNDIIQLFRGNEFRASVVSELPSGALLTTIRTELENLENLVNQAVAEWLGFLVDKPLNDDEKKFYTELQRCFESGEASQDLFLTLYSTHDLNYQVDLHQQSSQRNQERGLRDSAQSTSNFIDLRQPEIRAKVLEQIKYALASSVAKFPEPDQEELSLLESDIIYDTGLNHEEAAILSRTILRREDASAWASYLQIQDKESLKRVVRGIQRLQDSGSSLRFSPLRSFHQSYLACEEQLRSSEPRSTYANGGEYGLDASGLTAVKMLAAREFYLRGYPEGFQYGFDQKLPPAQINLTMEEWDLAVEGKANYGLEQERSEWALVQYLNQLRPLNDDSTTVDTQLIDYAREHANVSFHTHLSSEQIRLMIRFSLWENTHHQQMVNTALNNWFDSKKYPDEKPSIYHPDSKIADLLPQDREKIVEVLQDAYALFKTNPLDKGKIGYGEVPNPESIASRLLDVLTQDFATKNPSAKEASREALIQILQADITVDYASLSKETTALIGSYTVEDINEILRVLEGANLVDKNKQNLKENFQLLHLVSDTDRSEVAKKPICEVSLKAILLTHGENSVDWVVNNFQKSDLRDIILIGIFEIASDEQRAYFGGQIENLLTGNPDQYKAKKSVNFAFDAYYRDVKGEKDSADKFIGHGKVAENFPDLMKRRHSFATLAYRPHNADFVIYSRMDALGGRYGSIYQAHVADRLLKNEPTIFDRQLPFEQRRQNLLDAAPHRSVVRDIHLEIFLREELKEATNDAEKVEVGRALFPLFTKESSLVRSLACQVFQAELSVNPQFLQDFDAYIGLLEHYLPEPSLARNYFLTQLENSIPLTVEQLRRLITMRMSPEGKKTEDDDAPGTFIINKLGDLNREERMKATLWFLGMSQEKPKAVLEMERRFDGHLDNLPTVIAMSTDDEKEVTFKRLFLGAEGIVDLEAVSSGELPKAQAQRREFIDILARNLLPDSMPNAELLRKLFSKVIESSDPAHASRILTKLINKLTEATMQGEVLSPEEVIAIGLNELGVIGKKVSQSLAELEWVPDSYKKTFRKAQNDGEVVPKRALLQLAEDAGLTEEGASIRISAINDLIGAASNKQAALLTVEVKDDREGLSKGTHTIVGKFKRPSAQKTENIRHDLRVLQSLVETLNDEGYSDTLPKDFAEQIKNAVSKELDFTREKAFSEKMRTDLLRRNTKRRFSVNIPNIYYASDDIMMESRASGISLRQFKDFVESRGQELSERGYTSVVERNINQTLVAEALSQLIATGNIHADLHPGNIFINQQGELTLIDLGMHESLDTNQRFSTISLIAGLITGNETHTRRALKGLGWNISDLPLTLRKFNFAYNADQLLKASQRAGEPPSELIGAIILATSKLTTYTQELSNAELLKILITTVNKKEATQIITHLLHSRRRGFLPTSSGE